MWKNLARRVFAVFLLFLVFSLVLSASTERVLSTDPPTLQLIESDDPMVQRTGNWTSVDTAHASGGSYLYSSGSSDDVMTLDFQGTIVEIVYVQHPSLGTMAVEVDGTVLRTVNTAGDTAFDMHASFDYLRTGPHTLRVYASEGVIAVDAFVAQMRVVPETTNTSVIPLAFVVVDDPGSAGDMSILYVNSEDPDDIQNLDPYDEEYSSFGISGTNPVWSPSGDKILYSDGRVLKLLTWDGQSWETTPSWVFDTTDHISSTIGNVSGIAWSRQSNRVAFSAFDNGQLAIYCLDGIGDIPEPCEENMSGYILINEGASPTWSPDGSRIAYRDDDQIWVYELPEDLQNPSAPILLTGSAPECHHFRDPDWAPTGDLLVATCYSERDIGRENLQAYIGSIYQIDISNLGMPILHEVAVPPLPHPIPEHPDDSYCIYSGTGIKGCPRKASRMASMTRCPCLRTVEI